MGAPLPKLGKSFGHGFQHRTAGVSSWLLVAVVFGMVGTILLFTSHALTPTASIEAEGGSLGGSATTVTDSGASGGSAIKFGPSNSFVTAAGSNFMLGGSTFKWIGFDAYGMEGCYDGTAWTTAQLDSYFSQLPANGVTRIWAFQSYGTAPLQTILTEAAKYDQHLILVLGDDNASCGETDYSFGNQQGKTLQFYQSGWQDQWLSWVNTVVPLFKDNPQVMLWEAANEPGQKATTDPQPTLVQWQAYFQGTTDAIRADDPNHLIGMGTDLPGELGGPAAFKTLMATPNIDAVSFHDYSYEFENGAEVSSGFTNSSPAASQNNKPLYTGEAGVPGGATCADTQYTQLSQASRVNFLTTKATDYFNSGLAGIDFWEYEPFQASWVANCAYEMYPTDPMVDTVKNFVIP